MYPLEVGRISDFDVQNGVVNFRTHHNICCLPKATKDIRENWKSGAAIASSIAHRSQQSSRHFGVPPIHQQHSVALTLEGREWVLNQLRPNLEILVKYRSVRLGTWWLILNFSEVLGHIWNPPATYNRPIQQCETAVLCYLEYNANGYNLSIWNWVFSDGRGICPDSCTES